MIRHLLKKLIKKQIDPDKSWIDGSKKLHDMVKFQSFFSYCSSIEHCKKQAAIDWEYRFKIFKPFEKINKDLALEIGHGGGATNC